jgi:hypothetical protein
MQRIHKIVDNTLITKPPLTLSPKPPKTPNRLKRKVPLTVCIASICNSSTIFGASDRMITSGDIEFEPDLDSLELPPLNYPLSVQRNNNTKIFGITSSVVAMTAGDSGLQAEIMGITHILIKAVIAKTPTQWLLVRDAVDAYAQAYEQAKSKRRQMQVFSKYGLDEAAFISTQVKMSRDFVLKVTGEIANFESTFVASYPIETIITGVDQEDGYVYPHIYTVIKSVGGDSITCNDSIGFSAIGSGARHAESQFMLAGHSRYASSPETLLLTYLAKKRSEVAPGVGKGTDMFTIGPNTGSFAMLSNIEDISMENIDTIYQSVKNGEDKVFKRAQKRMKKYIEEVFKLRAEKQQSQQQQITAQSDSSQPPAESS